MVEKKIMRYQHKVCDKYGAIFCASDDSLKVGASLNIKDHIFPLNGLRIHPEGDFTGWFIWAGRGEPLTDADFFKPLHVIHIKEWCPEIIPYLGLPPGWRFLIAPNHEDVWFDENLLKTK